MSSTFEIPQAYQSGFVISGILENPAWKGLVDLSGYTAKASLLAVPTLAATVSEASAVMDIASFDPVTGRVPVKLILSALATPVPAGTYRIRFIAIDQSGKKIAGPTPPREQSLYVFTP